MSQLPVILILGATGHVGKETIIAISKDSTRKNYDIKAGVRDVNAGNTMLDSFGVEAVYCDYDVKGSVDGACNGVSKVFLILGNTENKLQECKIVVDAAKKANVKHFLLLSSIGCDSKQILFSKQFRECEEYIEKSGLKYTFLRSNFFQENLLDLSHFIFDGKLLLAIGEGKFAPVSVADVGEAACNILLQNNSNYDNKIINITGDQLLSGPEIAQILTKVCGKDVSYESPSKEETKDLYIKIGYNEWEANGLVELFQSFSKNEQNSLPNDNFSILNRKSLSLETTLNAHKDHFTVRGPHGLIGYFAK